MKKIYLLLLTCIPFILPAQHTLKSELNTPRTGDVLVKEKVAFCPAGDAGENKVWDFSKSRTDEVDYGLDYFSRMETEVTGSENGRLLTYSLSGDSLLMKSYEDVSNLVKYHHPVLLVKFPLEYGSSSGDDYLGRGKHNDRLQSLVTGKSETRADAYGALVLPGGDTLKHVVRVHIHREEDGFYELLPAGYNMDLPIEQGMADSLQSEASADRIITDTYQWYEEGYRYPVFETVESYRKSGERLLPLQKESFFYYPEDQAMLPEDEANQLLLAGKEKGEKIEVVVTGVNPPQTTGFRYYPNPVKDKLEVELILESAVSLHINLYDLSGRLLYTSTDAANSGLYHQSVPMQAYPRGTYLLKIQAGDKIINEKIVKH